MKVLPLIIGLILTSFCNAQSTVSRDTLTDIHQDIQVSFSVTSTYDSTEFITIEHFNIVDSDTISVFIGTYNINEDDPSDFVTFSLDEATGIFEFGIGAFIPSPIYSKVTVEKIVGLPEEFIFN